VGSGEHLALSAIKHLLWRWSDAGRQAGRILGIKQPHVSALTRNRAGNFSVGRLIAFLTALGQDARVTVKPTRKRVGEMEVVG
jgi:predicted XRE-type DNA-binding protein